LRPGKSDNPLFRVHIHGVDIHVPQSLIGVRFSVERFQRVADDEEPLGLEEQDLASVPGGALVAPAESLVVDAAGVVVSLVRAKGKIERLIRDVILTRLPSPCLALAIDENDVVSCRGQDVAAPFRGIVGVAAALDQQVLAIGEDHDAQLVLVLVAVAEGTRLETQEQGLALPAGPHDHLARVRENVRGVVRRRSFFAVCHHPLEILAAGKER